MRTDACHDVRAIRLRLGLATFCTDYDVHATLNVRAGNMPNGYEAKWAEDCDCMSAGANKATQTHISARLPLGGVVSGAPRPSAVANTSIGPVDGDSPLADASRRRWGPGTSAGGYFASQRLDFSRDGYCSDRWCLYGFSQLPIHRDEIKSSGKIPRLVGTWCHAGYL